MNHYGTCAAGCGRLRGVMTLVLAAALGLTAACGGPQLKRLTDQRYRPLDAGAKVDVFIGEIKPPYQEVAIIESDAFAYVDNEVKKKQLDQLKLKARRMGANVVMNVKILSKRVRGYTIDERVPFAAWQQGQYELYFMRGTAIRVPESEPANVAEARPSEGWIVESMPVPPPLTQPAVPLPGLRGDGATTQSQAK